MTPIRLSVQDARGKRRNISTPFASVLFALILSATSFAQVSVALRIEDPIVSWGESQLAERLLYDLSAQNGLEITRISGPLVNNTGEYSWESGSLSSVQITRWGQSQGHRYVVLFSHIKTELSVRKGLSIPIVLSRYRVIGEVSGKLRIFDCERGKILVDEEFAVSKKGPGAWQLLEDNPRSGKLSIPANEKPVFLESLEWKTVTELVSKLRKKMRLR
ncbi:hypothetical protein JYT16_00830 [Gemmatimonas aurantiaca]|nr:hypothetical protein [Gemmatimonas aurantiaca]